MKYIAQYIKKLCPSVDIIESKTTDSTYYKMSDNFVIRLSSHIGWYEKGRVSVVKSFNTDDFIVIVDSSPFPLIKSRREVKMLIRDLYDYNRLITLSSDFHEKKYRAEIDSIEEWGKFWSKACDITSNARYFGTELKNVIKKYFESGIRGQMMIEFIKKIKPVTTVETVETMFKK